MESDWISNYRKEREYRGQKLVQTSQQVSYNILWGVNTDGVIPRKPANISDLINLTVYNNST